MKAKVVKKTKSNAPISRKASGMIDEKGKSKIVEEVKSGRISCLGASRKYGVSRNSIKAWAGKINLTTFLSADKFLQPLDITQNQESKLLLKKIQELTKALELSRLKNLPLETMIEVAESDFHIKIQKSMVPNSLKNAAKSSRIYSGRFLCTVWSEPTSLLFSSS